MFILLGTHNTSHASNGKGVVRKSRPPSSLRGLKRGQEAIEALGSRLPQVAARHRKSAEKLRELLLQDKDLWVDSDDNLLYICSNLPEGPLLEDVSSQTVEAAIVPYPETFFLHSLPGASKVIHLDFDGHVTPRAYWNNLEPIVSVPFNFFGDPNSFSDSELYRIQKIWERVSEDYIMYNIDVTTEDPGADALRRSRTSEDENYGIRVVISPSSDWFGYAGGAAKLGSFELERDIPCFAFSNNLNNGNEKIVAEVCSHEVGHTLGLIHDGHIDGTVYYQGHGDWAPIMGSAYSRSITQWSRGEYAGANNGENDLEVMQNYGPSYRDDDYGNSMEAATTIILEDTSIAAKGIIEKRTDVDVFKFTTESGSISINIDPAERGPNLDILAELYNSLGEFVASSDPAGLPASIDMSVPAGDYYLYIDGVGTGDPSTGYSDYASIGQYLISGIVADSNAPIDDFANSETTIRGTIISNDYLRTFDSDDIYEVLDEEATKGSPSTRYSLLEHKWQFDVTGGDFVTFHVEASCTDNNEGDDFIFEYSTDDVNFIPILTVTKTAYSNILLKSFSLPDELSGTIYVRLADTDHSPGNTVLDRVFIDQMFIRSENMITDPKAYIEVKAAIASNSSSRPIAELINKEGAQSSDPDDILYIPPASGHIGIYFKRSEDKLKHKAVDANSITSEDIWAEKKDGSSSGDEGWLFTIRNNCQGKNIIAHRYGQNGVSDPYAVPEDTVDLWYVNRTWIQSGSFSGITSGVYDRWRFDFYNYADINRDGKVDFGDCAILAKNYGRTGIDCGANPNNLDDYSDIDRTGIVDFNDLRVFSVEWLYGCLP
jgi:hypothetical protein